ERDPVEGRRSRGELHRSTERHEVGRLPRADTRLETLVDEEQHRKGDHEPDGPPRHKAWSDGGRWRRSWRSREAGDADQSDNAGACEHWCIAARDADERRPE